jgi:hypothetical protein
METARGPITVAELQARCEVIEPGIILIRQPIQCTGDTLEVLAERAQELGASFERFAVVSDFGEVLDRPKGDYLHNLIRIARAVGVHWACVEPRKAFLRTVLRFVLARIGYANATIHANVDEAIAAARSALSNGAATPPAT